MWENRKKK